MVGQEFLDNLWRRSCGLTEKDVQKVAPDIDEIIRSQSNPKFERLRLNRMILCFFRYGNMHQKNKYDNIGSAIKRLQNYQKTGNSEYLVDAANLCMIEFTQEKHERFHFASIDDGEHTKGL